MFKKRYLLNSILVLFLLLSFIGCKKEVSNGLVSERPSDMPAFIMKLPNSEDIGYATPKTLGKDTGVYSLYCYIRVDLRNSAIDQVAKRMKDNGFVRLENLLFQPKRKNERLWKSNDNIPKLAGISLFEEDWMDAEKRLIKVRYQYNVNKENNETNMQISQVYYSKKSSMMNIIDRYIELNPEEFEKIVQQSNINIK